jgi:TetR/AcrR family transcriptional regulator, transcriptional repressor for nem operon
MPPDAAVRPIDTRDRLLAAGAELVSKKGFNGCGLTEVLEKAGVPKGSFYHYFASKEEFGVALIEHTRDGYLEQLKPILSDRKLTPLLRLRRIFELCRDEWAAGPQQECLIAKMGMETAHLSEPVQAAVRCAYQQWSALLTQVIREGQAAGEIERRHDADRLGKVLVMLWEGAVMRIQIDRNIDSLNDFLTFVFDTLLPDPRR